jgi:outer membrane protein TolC
VRPACAIDRGSHTLRQRYASHCRLVRLQVGGRATALDVIDAQRTLAADEQSLAQLQSTISEDQIAVFLALGGGWETGS